MENASKMDYADETALHVAVKNKQFGVIMVLLEWIRDMNKADVFEFEG